MSASARGRAKSQPYGRPDYTSQSQPDDVRKIVLISAGRLSILWRFWKEGDPLEALEASPRGRPRAGAPAAAALARALFVLLVAGLAAVGCGKSSRSSPTAPTGASTKSRRVLAFGDSLTVGVTTAGGRTFIVSRPYPTVLGDLLRTLNPESSTSNAGIGGEVTMVGAGRFPGTLAGSGANVVLILEGVNDVRRLFPADFIVANLRSMVRTAKTQGVAAIIGTIPRERLSPDNPTGPLIDEVNGLIRAMAAQEEIPVADFFLSLTDTLISEDGFHPTQAGYEVMAQVAFQVIAALP